MSFVRYFLGTRKKQWRSLLICLFLIGAWYIYWNIYLWYVPTQRKLHNSKLRDFLSGISQTKVERHSIQPYANTRKMSKDSEVVETSNNTVTTAFPKLATNRRIVSTFKSSETRHIQTNPSLEESLSQNVSYNVHIFYYPWYGSPEFDGKYIHWNHEYLQHWQPEIARKFRKGAHKPPNDIGSDFYPELGCYSSSDPSTIRDHFRQIRTSGAGVVVVSWYPEGSSDQQGVPVDRLVPKLLKIADEFKLKLTLHIEPYKNRDDKTVRDDIVYITDNYAKHPAFYKYKTEDNRYLPLLYVYDTYHTAPEDWANLLTPKGSRTIRNTPYDCFMIALMVEANHKKYIELGGFDGFYTYFAVNGFTYGSRWQEWPNLKEFSEKSKSLFIPSVGPGYIDTSIRPWNSENTRYRKNGNYYSRSFNSALAVSPKIISITSFNEWHEGTQIEKAVPKSRFSFTYKDYLPQNSDYYLQLTRKYVDMFK